MVHYKQCQNLRTLIDIMHFIKYLPVHLKTLNYNYIIATLTTVDRINVIPLMHIHSYAYLTSLRSYAVDMNVRIH